MKIAVVTGASSGMGREMARQIGDRFAAVREVWVIARREERLQELAREMTVPVRIFPLDLTQESALKTLEQALREQKPQVEASACEPGVEDAYMYLMQEKEGFSHVLDLV